MKDKHYTVADCEFVFEWAYKWRDLTYLLWEIFPFDKDPNPPPPTKDYEQRYQELRRWFAENESKISPLWQDFWRDLDWTKLLNDTDDTTENLEEIDSFIRKGSSNEFIEDLSLFMYKPKSLRDLVFGLGINHKVNIWAPDKGKVWIRLINLMDVSVLVIAFTEWIDKRQADFPYAA